MPSISPAASLARLGGRRADAREPDRREREHDRRPVEPREVAGDDEPQLGGDDDRGRRRADDRRAPDRAPRGRASGAKRNHGTTSCAKWLPITSPRWNQRGSRCACRLRGPGIGWVSWWYMSAVRSRHSRPPRILIMPAPNSRRNTSHQNSTITTVDGRLRVRSEEGREEPRLEQQHLPAEAVEGLPDAHDRHVAEPQREEAQHRHPGRAELRDAEHQRRADGDARRAQRDEPPVGVARRSGTAWAAAAAPAALAKGRAHASSSGAGSSPCSPRSAAELVQRREERDDVERRDAPLQHLPRELEVDRREPVHGVTSGRGPQARRGRPRCRAAPVAPRTSRACR